MDILSEVMMKNPFYNYKFLPKKLHIYMYVSGFSHKWIIVCICSKYIFKDT